MHVLLQRSKARQADQKAADQTPVTVNSEPVIPEPKKAEPKAPPPEVKKAVVPKVPVRTPPRVAPPSVENDFCKKLNIETGSGAGNLDHLYNSDEALAKTMPSAELEASRSLAKKN